MKKLVLELTDEQHARLAILGALFRTTPDKLAIACTFAGIDSWGSSLPDMEEAIQHGIRFYAEERNAHNDQDDAVEDAAPPRLLELAKAQAAR